MTAEPLILPANTTLPVTVSRIPSPTLFAVTTTFAPVNVEPVASVILSPAFRVIPVAPFTVVGAFTIKLSTMATPVPASKITLAALDVTLLATVRPPVPVIFTA